MINKFNKYLEKITLTKIVKGRINEVLLMNQKIYNEEIRDIFVCEMKNKEGARSYTSLWLFSDEFCFECKNFLNSFNFDKTPYSSKLDYCSIEIIEFDLKEPNEKSIVNIHFEFRISLAGDLIATESNCLSAIEIYKKYIIPNLNK